MKSRNYMIMAIAIIFAVWSAGQMARKAWAVEPAAPTVNTYGMANNTPTSATLKGDYRPNDLQIDSVYFEYGTTISYGTKVSPTQECKVYASGKVCEAYSNLTNLTPQQTYHYRLVVKYFSKVWKEWRLAPGEDKTFFTNYPPKATTTDATEISSTSAVLHGTANPNGNNTNAYFQYQPFCVMCSAPSSAAGQNVGSGTSPVTVNTKLTGLKSGTKYLYRMCATSSYGTSYGDYKTFFTPSKPAVTTYDAANIGTHAATLKGSVNPSGLDTMYYFEFGETASYGTKKSQVYAGKGTDPTPVSLDLPNSFTPGKLYHYRIVASNTMGVSYGEDKTFTAEKLIAPSAATGNAMDITLSAATLNGVVNPHNDQTMWHFEYRKAGAEWKKTDNAGANVENNWDIKAKIWSLDPDTTYYYKLVATNGGGTTTGEEKTFKTAALALPTAATGPAKNVTKSSATVTGTINPNDTPTSYWFWYGTSTQYANHTTGQIGLTGKNDISVSADLIGLAPNTTYYYRISASNIKGSVEGENKTFKTADVSQLPAVNTSQARNVQATSATIGGTVNPNGLNTTYYFQYGTTPSYGSTAPATPQSAGNGTNAVSVSTALLGLKANTTYYYRLAAVNGAGTSYGMNMTFKTTSSTLMLTPSQTIIRK